MNVIHNLGILTIKKDIKENVGFLLTNKKGSYCSFFNAPTSRYQGLFYFDEKTMDMYKFIENIEIVTHNDVDYLKNGFYFAERKKDAVIESFLMPINSNSLIYELDFENEIDLILDCRNSYDNREWGRCYDILEEHGCIVIKFTKKTDRREDSSDGTEEFALYLAIKSDNNVYEKNDRWIERQYYFDEQRSSLPFRRYVYNALRLKGSIFTFSMSIDKIDAIKECEYIFNNLHEIKNNEKEFFFNLLKNESIKKIITNEKINKEIKIAYINTFNSLNNLIVNTKNTSIVSEFAKNKSHSHSSGLMAGLPWFFQFWARDTLISFKAVSKLNEEFAKRLFFRYLNIINEDGRLPNLAGSHKSINLGNADAHGWLFFRCAGIVDRINKNKEVINSIKKSVNLIKNNKNSSSMRTKEYLKKCNLLMQKKENEHHKIIYEIESSLEKSLNNLFKFHTKDEFETNEKLETWMDTEFENDDRKGIRIEIQALRLNMYKLMFELTQNQKYKIIENLLRNKVRENFWNGKILADGLNDFTIRPNIFIAAYVYPELLANKEWETCFNNSQKSLWLDWGGLSTIDKSNPLFTSESTGENKKSYHRGDSWFWINNMAAIQLNKINKNKFNKQIKK